MFAPDDDVDEASRGKTETEDTARDSTAESAIRQNITDDGSEVRLDFMRLYSIFSLCQYNCTDKPKL